MSRDGINIYYYVITIALVLFNICPRISPSGFCCVWTLTYVCSLCIPEVRVDSSLPAIGPSRLAAVMVPSDNKTSPVIIAAAAAAVVGDLLWIM